MGWLVGIVVLIVALRFWRVALPIIAVAGLALFLWLQSQERQEENARQERADYAQQVRATITAAQQNPTPKKWSVVSERDPASGQDVPRRAVIKSDDGLCRLEAEERINGDRLASIDCSNLRVAAASWQSIEVKFDDRSTSDPMKIRKFSSGSGAYIPSSSQAFGGFLEYDEFLRRLSTANKVSLRLEFMGADAYWITFSLTGAADALSRIGAI